MTDQIPGEVPQTRAKWKAGAGLFAAVLVVFGLVWISKSSSLSPYAPLEVEFLQFTNSPAGDRYAVFSIHNPHNRAVAYHRNLEAEIWWMGEWRRWRPTTIPTGEFPSLRAGGTAAFAVEVPAVKISDGSELASGIYGSPWVGFLPGSIAPPQPDLNGIFVRVQIVTGYTQGWKDYWHDLISENWANLRQGRPLVSRPAVNFRQSTTFSPVVTNILEEP